MWAVGLLGTGILTGIGFILKSLSNQNLALGTQGQALALLVARVGNINPEVVDRRILELETDMVRVWGILMPVNRGHIHNAVTGDYAGREN